MLNKKFIGLIVLMVSGMQAATLDDLQSDVAKLQKNVQALIDQGKQNSQRINDLLTQIQQDHDQDDNDAASQDQDRDVDVDYQEDDDMDTEVYSD